MSWESSWDPECPRSVRSSRSVPGDLGRARRTAGRDAPALGGDCGVSWESPWDPESPRSVRSSQSLPGDSGLKRAVPSLWESPAVSGVSWEQGLKTFRKFSNFGPRTFD